MESVIDRFAEEPTEDFLEPPHEPSRVSAVTESGLKRKADFGSVGIKVKAPPGVSRNQLYARIESILTHMTVELVELLHDLGARAQFGQSAEIGAITGDFKAQPDEDITVTVNFIMPNVPGASGEWQTVDQTLRNASDEIYAFMRELRRQAGVDPS